MGNFFRRKFIDISKVVNSWKIPTPQSNLYIVERSAL